MNIFFPITGTQIISYNRITIIKCGNCEHSQLYKLWEEKSCQTCHKPLVTIYDEDKQQQLIKELKNKMSPTN